MNQSSKRQWKIMQIHPPEQTVPKYFSEALIIAAETRDNLIPEEKVLTHRKHHVCIKSNGVLIISYTTKLT